MAVMLICALRGSKAPDPGEGEGRSGGNLGFGARYLPLAAQRFARSLSVDEGRMNYLCVLC